MLTNRVDVKKTRIPFTRHRRSAKKFYMYKPQFNSRKFRNLALYLAHKAKDDPHFGMVKLWITMYYCDTIAFVRTGKPITGATYEKRSFGPYPREWGAELKKMLGKA